MSSEKENSRSQADDEKKFFNRKPANNYGETQEEIDLHWFRGWGERLKSINEKSEFEDSEFEPSQLDWMIFRPDTQARDAMIRMGSKYSVVIKQVDEYLDYAEKRFDDLCDLLPPIGCPSCESAMEFEDKDGIRHCWLCGERTELPAVRPAKIEDAKGAAHEAYDNLSRVILVASETIENNLLEAKIAEEAKAKAEEKAFAEEFGLSWDQSGKRLKRKDHQDSAKLDNKARIVASLIEAGGFLSHDSMKKAFKDAGFNGKYPGAFRNQLNTKINMELQSIDLMIESVRGEGWRIISVR